MFNYTIDITNNCNLRCRMCCSHDAHEPNECEFFDADIYARHISREGLNNAAFLQIGSSAEPLLHKDFSAILHHTRSVYDGEIRIVTNGTLLHNHYKEILQSSTSITVSIDSLLPERYARIRGADLHKVLENLRLIDPSKVDIWINATISRENIDEVKSFKDFCKHNGYNLRCFTMSLRANMQAVLLYENCYNSLAFSKSDNNYIDTAFQEAKARHIEERECLQSAKTIYTHADGSTLMCQQFYLGSLKANSLETILFKNEKVRTGKGLPRGVTCVPNCNVRCKCYGIIDGKLLMDHFDSSIYSLLEARTLSALSLNSQLSDVERLQCFFQDISKTLPIWHMVKTSRGYTATKITDFSNISHPRELDALYADGTSGVTAKTQAKLFALIASSTKKITFDSSCAHIKDLYSAYIDEHKPQNIIIWGTGGRYMELKEIFCNTTIRAFVSNNAKDDDVYEDVPHVSPKDLLQFGDLPIFICSHALIEIERQIIDINGEIMKIVPFQ